MRDNRNALTLNEISRILFEVTFHFLKLHTHTHTEKRKTLNLTECVQFLLTYMFFECIHSNRICNRVMYEFSDVSAFLPEKWL